MRDGPLLIVDCDPGHDDALALGLAHAHANVLGITSVSGNAPLEDTTRNALGMAHCWAVLPTSTLAKPALWWESLATREVCMARAALVGLPSRNTIAWFLSSMQWTT